MKNMKDDENQNGIPEDFLLTIEKTWESLYKFIYYKVQNREEAEDITQEAYLKALSYLKNGEVKIDKYLCFLKTVSLNIMRDKWRKKKRDPSFVVFMDEDASENDDFTTNIEDGIFIENALSILSEEQREVINLRIIKGLTVSATAEILGLKEGNIRVLQYRALKNLSKALNNKEVHFNE